MKNTMVDVYYSEAHKAHLSDEMHPENPLRVENIMATLRPSLGTGIHVHVFDDKGLPTKVTKKWLLSDGDTYVTDQTNAVLETSRLMIAAAVSHNNHVSFVLCRPPGHHASPGRVSGFCHENNAWYAVTQLVGRGVRNICIYDMDAHHGDGTEVCVRANTASEYAGVRFVSTHAYGAGIYPGSGAASKDEKVLNLPLRRGTGVSAYMRVFRNDVLPFIGKPEILIVSAGYDAHENDPMQLLKLKTSTYGAIAEGLKDLGVPVLFLLEGGYNTMVLGACVMDTIHPWLFTN